jgi:hypothetical protein
MYVCVYICVYVCTICTHTCSPSYQVELMHILKQHMSNSVEGSAYNWIRPSLWSTLFARTTGAREGKEGARDRDGQLSIGMGVSVM